MRPRAHKIATLVAALFIPVLAWGGSAEVTASRLNVRTGPSTGYRVLGSVSRGTTLETLGPKRGSWVQVRYRGRSAWVHGKYLKTVSTTAPSTNTSSTETFYVTAGSLNVRSGPSTRYRRIGSLSRGSAVDVLSRSGSWRKIKLQSGTGWVHGNYLSANKPSSTPPSSGSTPSRKGYIQLSNSGPGYYGYYAANRRWGTPTMIYGIQRVARRFITANPRAPRLGVGDISFMNGGPISGHASHQKGVDADFRPIRNDGVEGRATIHQSVYSRSLNQKVFDLFKEELRIRYIFFNDRNTRHTTPWPNHDNHFHVRIY